MESPKWYQADGRWEVLGDHRVNINCVRWLEGLSAFNSTLQGLSGYNMWISLVVMQLLVFTTSHRVFILHIILHNMDWQAFMY